VDCSCDWYEKPPVQLNVSIAMVSRTVDWFKTARPGLARFAEFTITAAKGKGKGKGT